MTSYLNLRYSGKIKQVRWPMDQGSFLQVVASLFSIKPENITGFKDKEGKVHTLNDLFIDPEETQKQSFMVLTQGEEKKPQNPSPVRDIRNLSAHHEIKPIEDPSKNLPVVLITSYADFERLYLKKSRDSLSIIFVLGQRQKIDDIAQQISPLIIQFSQKFEFFYYVHKGLSDELSIQTQSLPLILVCGGSKRLLEIPLGSNTKSIVSLLERINPTVPDTQEEDFQSFPVSFPENEANATAIKHLEDIFEQNEITGLEYYYLKSSILERRPEVVSAFSRYSKSRDIDQLKFEIKDICARELRVSQQSAYKSSKGPAQVMKQNYVRPLTSEGYSKSRTKEISSVQEKYIQIAAELERKGYLNEHSASLIKSLILEENADVFRVMSSYESGMYEDQDFSLKLVRLAEKLSPSIIRPTSPLPKKDELIRLVNNLVRKRLKDDTHLLLLNKLIMEGDELLYSSFDVFESDRDEEDLLDTLIRIVNKYKKMGKYAHLYASPFYASQKTPPVDNEQDFLKDNRKASQNERPPSQGSSSYFLESRAKSRKGGNRQVIENREHNIEKDVFSKKESYSPLHTQEPLDLGDALKSSHAVRSLPADEYGMMFWMVNNKPSLIKDVINDHGGFDAIDAALPSISLLANKELNTRLKEKLDERQRAYINDNKKVKNSASYAAFQCFKYDHDLEGLIKSLQEIVKNMPKENTQLGRGLRDSGKKEREYVTQNFEDLAVIREEDKSNTNKQTGQARENNSVTSIKVETPSQPQKSSGSTNNVLDTGRPSAGSKYTHLLNRDQRADSFKGLFQLKLISSDNPAANSEPTPQILESEGTKNSLDANLNVIIPPKSEMNPFTQIYIDKFYESQDSFIENLGKFKDLLSNFKWITPEEISKLEYLYENFYYELFEVISTYQINNNLDELERRIKDDILTVDLDNISIASASPRERKRMTAYHSFKALLQNLRNEKFISDKQYKSYLYLYTEEEITILAAYEVYQFTQDLTDFIDTLLLIEKVQFFKNESKYFEEISNFNDCMEYQLQVIFSLKRYLNAETRATLEKIIRSGDTTVMKIYQEYKTNRDNKNKNNLIHKLVNFAEENSEVVKNYEKSIAENLRNSEHKNVKRREQIEIFEAQNLLPEVKYYDLLYDSIDKDDEIIHSIFEIYDFTKDKIDFIENVTLVYRYVYRRNILNLLRANKEKINFTESTIQVVADMLKKKENIIMGPVELYYATKDEDEFLETISLLVQSKIKVTGGLNNYSIGNILNLLKANKQKINLTESSIQLVEDLLKKKENSIMGPVELYYAMKDEDDFLETISLLIQVKTKAANSLDNFSIANILNLLRDNKERINFTESTIQLVEDMLKRKDNTVMGPVELYYATKDEDDFLETISLLVQSKTKVTNGPKLRAY